MVNETNFNLPAKDLQRCLYIYIYMHKNVEEVYEYKDQEKRVTSNPAACIEQL